MSSPRENFIHIMMACTGDHIIGGKDINGKEVLPWDIGSLSGDLPRLKKITTDSQRPAYILIGRKTFESLPKSMLRDDRTFIVLTRDPEKRAWKNTHNIQHTTLERAIEFLKLRLRIEPNVFCLGGAEVVNTLLSEYPDLIGTLDLTVVPELSEEDCSHLQSIARLDLDGHSLPAEKLNFMEYRMDQSSGKFRLVDGSEDLLAKKLNIS